MTVNPLRVRTFQGLIDKLKWRIPFGNFRPPFDGQASNFEPVINQSSFLNIKRLQGGDVKIKFGRRDAFEVSGVGEKIENFRNR